jgi:hypothetical protein
VSRDRRTHDVTTPPDWPAIFDAYGVQFLLLNRVQDGELLRLVRSRPDWTVDSQDENAVLLARTRPIHQGREAQPGP